MAKNVTSKASAKQVNAVPLDGDVYSGSFIGNLTGNADTATRLAQGYHIHLQGDVTGTILTDGGADTTCEVTVLRAAMATDAQHATVADSVGHAATADTATQAVTAQHAFEADSAKTATNAEFAKQAENAKNASQATTALSATSATTAAHADFAELSEKAAQADIAQVAYELRNDAEHPVPEATHAKSADESLHAQRADYDCLGRLIHGTYLTKEEGVSKDEAFDQEQADRLYARKDEIITQATITGKALGYGLVTNQTLNLIVEDLALRSDGSAGLYEDLIFIDQDHLPDRPNTTKAYITSDQVLWLYDVDALHWVDIRSKLTPEAQEILDTLKNFVDLTSDQTIHGTKQFWDPVYAPIPSFTDAPDHAVAVLHNLRDLKHQLESIINSGDSELKIDLEELRNRVEELENYVYGISHIGDVYITPVDLNYSNNTVDMIPGAVYIGYLEEDKTFIPLNPDTFEQLDPEQVPYWERHWTKDSNGVIKFKDIPYVGKQTNLSYRLLDHVPSAEEAEDFEEDTWYYYPAKDAIGEEGGAGSGGIGLTGEFTSMNFLESASLETATVQNGEFNIYPMGNVLGGSGSGELPGGGGGMLAGDFERIEFMQGADPMTDIPALGNLNLYTAGDLIEGSSENPPPIGQSADFSQMEFKEGADIATDTVSAGSFNIYGVGDALSGAGTLSLSGDATGWLELTSGDKAPQGADSKDGGQDGEDNP